MKLKLELSPKLNDKFEEILAKQIGKNISSVEIKDIGKQYEFKFKMDGGNWHVELDKYGSNKLFRLYCSSIFLDIEFDSIKDLNRFCKQIDKIIEMQIKHVSNR